MKGVILVVDDETGVCDLLGDFFASRGYSVVTTNSGADGLRVFERLHPKIIFLDIRMPGMDGIEVVKKIRQSDKKVKVIMITGMVNKSLAEKALEYGASDYMLKPLDLKYISRVILVGFALQA